MAYKFLLESAKKYPDKAAVEHNEDKLTYRELLDQSKKLARFFQNNQVSKSSRIMVLIPKSIRSVVSLYGANMAGASISQLDTDYPAERLWKIISNLEPSFIVITEKIYAKLAGVVKDAPLKLIVDSWEGKRPDGLEIFLWDDIMAGSDAGLTMEDDDNRDAYILYTSGSTGEPKGVRITNKNLVSFTKANVFSFTTDSRVLNICPVFYDAFFGENTMAAAVGCTIVLLDKFVFPNEITATLDAKKITHCGSSGYVISLLAGKLSDLEKYRLENLKYLYFGGDSLLPKYLRAIKSHVPQITFINCYGQTEATILITRHEITHIPEDREKAFPIGKPFHGSKVYLFDQEERLIEPKPGASGEIYLAGDQIMAGYWKDEMMTKNAIKTDLIPGERLLRTGDLARIDENGDYEFVGRNSEMIKRGGNRIFLVEIEQAILGYPQVTEVQVIGIEEPGNFHEMKTIIGFVQIEDDKLIPDLKAYLKKRIPRYMIPDEIISIESMHLFNKGKIDKDKLKEYYLNNQETK